MMRGKENFIIKLNTKGEKLMEIKIKFYTTSNVRRILGIGNKTCLDLFHRSDFPCIKV